MKRELLEYLLCAPRTVELKLHDEFVGTYYETVKIDNVAFGNESVKINHAPYFLADIMHVRFIGSEDEIIEEIRKSPSLEHAMLFTAEEITPLVEIALNDKRIELREKRNGNVMEELKTACDASKLTVARVLRFMATNYGVNGESDYEGISKHYKQAIEKLKASPF